MLAVYLSSPEVENTRRGLNIRRGLRRSMKEGRWKSRAPRGYINSRDKKSKPICVPDQTVTKSGFTKAELIQNLFADYATGNFGIAELTKKYQKLGLGVERSAISIILGSHFYMGKIKVKA